MGANTRKGCKRESDNIHKPILLRDTGLENFGDLESCMSDERSSLMEESVFIAPSSRRRPKVRRKRVCHNVLCEKMVTPTQNNILQKIRCKSFYSHTIKS